MRVARVFMLGRRQVRLLENGVSFKLEAGRVFRERVPIVLFDKHVELGVKLLLYLFLDGPCQSKLQLGSCCHL